jgi:hypothetical protein
MNTYESKLIDIEDDELLVKELFYINSFLVN